MDSVISSDDSDTLVKIGSYVRVMSRASRAFCSRFFIISVCKDKIN